MTDAFPGVGLLAEEPRELSRKLSRYVRGGGKLFITVDSLVSLGEDGIAMDAAGKVVLAAAWDLPAQRRCT